jgi:hypothetical protein
MRDNFLSINDNNKVLMETQSLNSITSSSITEMRCRCAESRRINNNLILWERRNRKRIEYQRLRDSVPSIARRRVSDLTIITEAARLIDKLEAAVLNKFQSEGIPKFLQGLNLYLYLKFYFSYLLIDSRTEKKIQ